MARYGRPWAVVIAALACALVAGGALVTAAVIRADRGVAEREPAPTSVSSPTTPTVPPDGCMVPTCTSLGAAQLGGTQVDVVGDNGLRSGRLRIGGPESQVLEVTITTSMDATLLESALQCVPGTLAICIVRASFPGGLAAQVAVGRSGAWNWLSQPVVSDAGFLAAAEVSSAETGGEVVAAQHACDRTKTVDCSATPVFLQAWSSRGALVGCSRNYVALASLPSWPDVNLADVAFDIARCA